MFKLYKKADILEKISCASRDIRLVAILKQQLEGLLSCEDVQIVER